MSDEERISIELTPEMASFVREAVEAGEYASGTEVIQAALSEFKERHDLFGYTLEELRRLVQEGIDSGPGRFSSMEEIKAEVRRQTERR